MPEEGSNQLFKKEVETTVRDPIFVTVSVYRGKIRCDVRHHYEHKQTGQLTPGQKGVNFPLSEVAQLIEVLTEALATATEASESAE